MKIVMVAAVTFGAAFVAGCSPEQMETTPVVVQTAQGPVTCQLYTLSQVTWDRAISHPGAMDVRTADEACRAEGYRILRSGGTQTAPAPAEIVTPAGDTVIVESGL